VKVIIRRKINSEITVRKLPMVMIEFQLAYPSAKSGIRRGIPEIPKACIGKNTMLMARVNRTK